MFSQPRPNLVVSDAGFSMEVLGRTGIEYREGKKVMFIDSEVMAIGTVAVFAYSITSWRSPCEDIAVTDADKHRIIENLRSAFAFLEDSVEIVHPDDSRAMLPDTSRRMVSGTAWTTKRRRRDLTFGIVVLTIGLVTVALGLALLSEAFRMDRPDAAVFMRKLIAMAIPIIIFGLGVASFGLHRLCRTSLNHTRREN